jgi:hypothetical protein
MWIPKDVPASACGTATMSGGTRTHARIKDFRIFLMAASPTAFRPSKK